MNDIITIFTCCRKPLVLQQDTCFPEMSTTTPNNSINKTSSSSAFSLNHSQFKETSEPAQTSPKFNRVEECKANEANDEHQAQSNQSESLVEKDSIKKSSQTLVTFSNFQLKEVETASMREASTLSSKLLINGELFWNKNIIIDHIGMQNGLRKKQDGQAYFGISNTKDYSGTYLNDLVLNFTSTRTSNNSTGRVFDISFQKKTNDFQLYMIHSSLVLNYTIEAFFYFDYDREYYMLLGKVFMTFSARKRDKAYDTSR